jgi:AcrR family transcriptional regulator
MSSSMAEELRSDTLTEPGSVTWWDAHAARLERRRPRAGGLTVEQIVDVALELADTEGYDALTVRNLASRLDTSSATLYRHVASVEELRVLVVDRVLGEIDLADTDDVARERVVRLSVSFRGVLLDHPGVVPALRAAPLLGPNARRSAEAGFGHLLAIGLDPKVAVIAYLALIDFVLGSVYFDTAGAVHRDAGFPQMIDPDDPSLFARHYAELTGHGSDEVFLAGLQTFLDGLDAQHGPMDTRER